MRGLLVACATTESESLLGTFFVNETLIVIGMGGLVWMAIGVFIMAKMVSFEI